MDEKLHNKNRHFYYVIISYRGFTWYIHPYLSMMRHLHRVNHNNRSMHTCRCVMYFATLVCCWWRSIFLMVAPGNWLNSQILQCTHPISHNAPFRTEMCTFLFWMVYCGVCELVYCTIGFDWQCPIIDSSSDLVQARRLAITCTKDWRIYPSPSFNVFTFQTMTPKLIEWVISN